MSDVKYNWQDDTEVLDIIENANEHINITGHSRFAVIGIVVANSVSGEAACLEVEGLSSLMSPIELADYWKDAVYDAQGVYDKRRESIFDSAGKIPT